MGFPVVMKSRSEITSKKPEHRITIHCKNNGTNVDSIEVVAFGCAMVRVDE